MGLNTKARSVSLVGLLALLIIGWFLTGFYHSKSSNLTTDLQNANQQIVDSSKVSANLRTSNEVLNNIIMASNQELAATKKQVDSVNNLLRLEKTGRRADKNDFEAKLGAQKDACDLVLQNTKVFLVKDGQNKLRLREDYWSGQYTDVNLKRIIFADSLTYMSRWCQFYQHQDQRPWLKKLVGSGKIPPPEGHPPVFAKKK